MVVLFVLIDGKWTKSNRACPSWISWPNILGNSSSSSRLTCKPSKIGRIVTSEDNSHSKSFT